MYLLSWRGCSWVRWILMQNISVNTGFWSILEDDRWTRMREEGYSADKTSGRLNACAVGYSRRRWLHSGKQKMAGKADRKDESCNNKGLWEFRVRNRKFPSLFKSFFVNRSLLGLVFCLGYKYWPSTIVIEVHNQINTIGPVPTFESFYRVVEFFERSHRSVDLRKFRQPCYHV